jgi:hypothetical protein
MSNLRHTARLLRWRWMRNGGARLAFLLGGHRLGAENGAIVAELRESGICVRRNPSDAGLFEALRADALERFAAVWDGSRVRTEIQDWKGSRADLPAHEAKDFLVRLIPPKLHADSVYLRYAVQEGFLAVADAYLGMRAQLRAVHLWLNYPTEGEARSTQLWHRDSDDVVNLKIFTYLTDVDESSGPFAYAPATHPFGRRRSIEPRSFAPGRVEDGEMQRALPREEWRINVGPAGTTVFADTCGFHKGVKPVSRPRLMLMCHYTSPAAYSARDLVVQGPLDSSCTERQTAAIAASLQQ